MREIKILTVPFDPRLRIFDDEALVGYLKHRELLRAEPALFCHEGAWCWTVYLETRPLLGARPGVAAGPGAGAMVRSHGFSPEREPGARAVAGGRDGRVEDPQAEAERAAFQRLLRELDEVERARYDALLVWRRETAGNEGVPPYVILTNRQCMDLARGAPRTLEGLGLVKGIGRKRLRRHGAMLLEVLHGRIQGGERGAEEGGQQGQPRGDDEGSEGAEPGAGPAALRGLDGHDEVAPRADGEVPEAAPAKPE